LGRNVPTVRKKTPYGLSTVLKEVLRLWGCKENKPLYKILTPVLVQDRRSAQLKGVFSTVELLDVPKSTDLEFLARVLHSFAEQAKFVLCGVIGK